MHSNQHEHTCRHKNSLANAHQHMKEHQTYKTNKSGIVFSAILYLPLSSESNYCWISLAAKMLLVLDFVFTNKPRIQFFPYGFVRQIVACCVAKGQRMRLHCNYILAVVHSCLVILRKKKQTIEGRKEETFSFLWTDILGDLKIPLSGLRSHNKNTFPNPDHSVVSGAWLTSPLYRKCLLKLKHCTSLKKHTGTVAWFVQQN